MTRPPDRVRAAAVLRTVIMVLPPLALAVALLWHPAGGERVYEGVRDDVGAWLFVHVSFLLLTPLLACAVLLLLDRLHDRMATVSRVALVFFLVFYTAYEVTIGVGTGVLVNHGKDLPASDQAVLADAVQDFSRNPFTADPLSISLALGSLGWVVAMLAAATGFRRTGRGRAVTLLLGGAALFVVHPPPVGPVALVCFAAACVLVERSRSREARADVPQMRSAAASDTETGAIR